MLPILLFLTFAIQELPFGFDLQKSAEQKLVTAPEKSLQSIFASFESRLLLSLEANNSLFEELELSPRQQRKILSLRSEALANEESQETLRAKILNEALDEDSKLRLRFLAVKLSVKQEERIKSLEFHPLELPIIFYSNSDPRPKDLNEIRSGMKRPISEFQLFRDSESRKAFDEIVSSLSTSKKKKLANLIGNHEFKIQLEESCESIEEARSVIVRQLIESRSVAESLELIEDQQQKLEVLLRNAQQDPEFLELEESFDMLEKILHPGLDPSYNEDLNRQMDKVVARITADCASKLEKILLPHQQQALSHIAVRAFFRQENIELFEWPLALREDLELADSETKLIETKTKAVREKFDSVVGEEFSRSRDSIIQLFPEESRNEIQLFLEYFGGDFGLEDLNIKRQRTPSA